VMAISMPIVKIVIPARAASQEVGKFSSRP